MNDRDQAEFDAWRAARDADRRGETVAAAPAVPLPVALVVDEMHWVKTPGGVDQAEGWHLYEGARIGIFANPDNGATVVVHAIGGEADEPGEIPDGVAFTLTRDGLTRLAAELIAAARTIGGGE